MFDFKRYLTMGGNVVLGDDAAERIDLEQHNRSDVVRALVDSLKQINRSFRETTKLQLWSDTLISSGKFLSGSAAHFFDLNAHTDEEFSKVKRFVGDIDTMVPDALTPFIRSWLSEVTGHEFGDLKLIGHKESAGQFITLWYSKSLQQNIQIDMERQPFEEGVPSTWSQFSHSSSWDDMKVGLKGVAHKYLLRALNAKDLQNVIIRMKTKDKPIVSATHAMSLSGLRPKIEPVLDSTGSHEHKEGVPVYREIPSSEVGFNTNLEDIFIHYFGHDPSSKEEKQMWSFTGLLQLISSHFDHSDCVKIADGFANTIWGPGAQKLYRDNNDRDLEEKSVMIDALCSQLGVDRSRYNQLEEKYYK